MNEETQKRLREQLAEAQTKLDRFKVTQNTGTENLDRNRVNFPKAVTSAESLVNQPDKIELPDDREPDAPTVEPFEIPELEELRETRGGIEDKIFELENQLSDSADIRQREQEDLDIAGRKESLNESRKRLIRLQGQGDIIEANIRKEFEGSRTSERAVSGMINKQKRENFVAIRQEQATFEALRGDLNTALDLVDDAVKAEIEPLQFKLNIRKQQLDAIEDSIEPFEKAQFEAQKKQLAKEEKELKTKESDIAEVRKLNMALVEAGAPLSVRKELLEFANIDNVNVDKAIDIAAPYLVKKQTGSSVSTGSGGSDVTATINRLRGEGRTDAEIRAFLDTNTKLTVSSINELLGDSKDDRFLDENYFRNLFTTDQLQEAAAAAGFKQGGSLFDFTDSGVGKEGIDNYLQSVMLAIDARRKAGFTDQQILKEFK